jgi:hypothetical protein
LFIITINRPNNPKNQQKKDEVKQVKPNQKNKQGEIKSAQNNKQQKKQGPKNPEKRPVKRTKSIDDEILELTEDDSELVLSDESFNKSDTDEDQEMEDLDEAPKAEDQDQEMEDQEGVKKGKKEMEDQVENMSGDGGEETETTVGAKTNKVVKTRQYVATMKAKNEATIKDGTEAKGETKQIKDNNDDIQVPGKKSEMVRDADVDYEEMTY